ncbi:acetyl-CoA carboxylase biotin carboxyl carrier protein [Peloplasma aerotolerans]|jgi:acetyl-CoA carboxylase biotin carboxyl carrier protein|uniref:Biotin carboxyl carrier protein of acetyl-CoA carboxylase n=1 Tax=Peloplasma aerotolerans TaxID=3044389 RepID=A0AAW6U524_9MOLU|nr:acetyl-CoA carboxylase biotin carboxyl carrier protein [Mariniplasma sp. M4Ah]MDI6452992.1 acetyl-CoA carboxylase biotin carboxyl carrier protein [Mariniplasma sp. M4Ah]
MTIKEIQNIIKDFESSSLMSLELEMDNFKLRLSKNKDNHIVVNGESKEEDNGKQTNSQQAQLKQNNQNVIQSPLVGTFYASATPNGKPFVEVGQQVKKGQVVCIIEAMKIMNEITSPFDGVIKEVFVHNGEVVGYNHTLMRVGDKNEK